MIKAAFLDIVEGLKRWDLWLFLGWHDVKQRYRRSSLGPFWITLATALFVTAMTLVYAGLFRQQISTFLPLVACGTVIWAFIAGCLVDGSTVFVSASATIKQVPAPLTIHVFRLVWNQLIYLAHNAVVVVIALAFAGVPLRAETALVFPALVLLLVNLSWMALLLGAVGARYRDVPLIVQSFITGLFMVTPVLWQISFLPPDRQWLAYVNPFTYLLEIVRVPLLGTAPSATLWAAVILMAVAGWLASVLIYARARTRLAYWI
jgi:ABC-type polysaccharide/polyol phosphate export permease